MLHVSSMPKPRQVRMAPPPVTRGTQNLEVRPPAQRVGGDVVFRGRIRRVVEVLLADKPQKSDAFGNTARTPESRTVFSSFFFDCPTTPPRDAQLIYLIRVDCPSESKLYVLAADVNRDVNHPRQRARK